MEKYTEIEIPLEAEKRLEVIANDLGMTKEEALAHVMEFMLERIKSGEVTALKPQNLPD
jgi:predicted DNA-binding protein